MSTQQAARGWWKALIVVLLLVAVAAVAVVRYRHHHPAGPVSSKTESPESAAPRPPFAADNPLDKALATKRPVVADFGRGTCIPCKMMKPILDELAEEYGGKAEILIIDIDEYPLLTQRCGIRTIPTQIFYDVSGTEVSRHIGFMPKEDIEEQLRQMGVE